MTDIRVGSWYRYPGVFARNIGASAFLNTLSKPFLTPLPPAGSNILATVLLPFGYAIGVLRTAVILALGVGYVMLVSGACTVLYHHSIALSHTS